jgi:hypothetical protein
MTSSESDVPEPERRPATHHQVADDPSATRPVKKHPAVRRVAGGVVAVALLGGAGAIAYGRMRPDSGVAACESMRDGRLATKLGVDGGLTEPQYQQIRRQFNESGNEEIRARGTRLIDTVWQVQHVGETPGPGLPALMGPLVEHATALRSACAHEGVVFDLTGLGATAQPSGSGGPNAAGTGLPGVAASGAPAGAEGAAAVSTSYAWPDGMTVYLDGVQVVDRTVGRRIPASTSLVTVTCTYRNTAPRPIAVRSTAWVTVLYGSDRTVADSAAAKLTGGAAKRLSNADRPARIEAGDGVQRRQTFLVPDEDLTLLAVRVQPPAVPGSTGARAPYTFTEVEKVLKR